jgi:peptidyl-prolyl cis-trans isomerase A (cyclophilin A)
MGLLLLSLSAKGDDTAGYAQFNTTMGIINVRLLTEAPLTVNNFTTLVGSGSYTDALIYRSISSDPAIFQAGDYIYNTDGLLSQNTDTVTVMGEHDPTANPTAYSNTAGTIAMALSNGPNTGSNVWFFNMADNSAILDGTADGGPFTVFGVVADQSSYNVMQSVGSLSTGTFGLPYVASSTLTVPSNTLTFPNLPYYISGGTYYAILVNSITNVSLVNITSYLANMPTNLPAGSNAPSAIPFNDGVPNIVKYLCHINPNAPMSATARANLPTMTSTTGGIATYTYHQYAMAFGVTAIVQTSTDLQNWSTVTAYPELQNDANGDFIMNAQVAMSGNKQFFRLQITPPPAGNFIQQE